jgi:hypothetical protein
VYACAIYASVEVDDVTDSIGLTSCGGTAIAGVARRSNLHWQTAALALEPVA